MPDESDEIARAQNGDLQAFDCLVGRYQTKIYNFCLWFLGNETEAADCAQDTFIRAFRGLKSFRGDAQFSTWLGRIALNVCRDAHAKRKKAPRDFTSLENEDGEAPEFLAPGLSPDAVLQKHERIQAVHAALAQLSPEHRAVLVMYDLQGHSYEESATMLSLPIGTVKSRLNRARLALKHVLEGQRELFDA